MRTIVEWLIKQVFRGIGLFHKEKLIYFESFHGTQYSDNPKAIYEWMGDNYPEYQLIWGVNKSNEKPFLDEKVSYVFRFSFKWFLTMPRAGAWVINTRTPLWLYKNKKTSYVQTWHGTPLKKIGRDIDKVNIPGYTKESYDTSFSLESARWDYLVSPSEYTTKIFKQAFDYQGDILEVGYPRNDVLINLEKESKIQEALKIKLGIPRDKKIILYAPTWREKDSRNNGKYSFSIEFPFEKILRKLDKETILLVRMHYLVAQEFDFSVFNEQVINVSEGIDMSELLAISDLLITDYSSCFFDFSLTGKPMLFFIPDQEEYEKEMRGVYFEMAGNVPGELLSTEQELIDFLKLWEKTALKNEEFTMAPCFTTFETGEAAQKVSEVIAKKKEG